MTSAAYVDQAAKRGRWLRDLIARHNNTDAKSAMPIAAERLNIGPGSFQMICRGTLKEVGAHVYDALQNALARELLVEAQMHVQEIAALMADGSDPRSDQVLEVAAQLAKID
jgi:hypothetical protein